MQSFEDWFRALIIAAKKRGCEHIINADDPDSYRDGYEDGNSVDDELEEQIYSAAASQ